MDHKHGDKHGDKQYISVFHLPPDLFGAGYIRDIDVCGKQQPPPYQYGFNSVDKRHLHSTYSVAVRIYKNDEQRIQQDMPLQDMQQYVSTPVHHIYYNNIWIYLYFTNGYEGYVLSTQQYVSIYTNEILGYNTADFGYVDAVHVCWR